MNLPQLQRTIKWAIDLDSMSRITSDDLLEKGIDYFQPIRLEATRRYQENNPKYVCPHCQHPTYISTRQNRPLWQHYKGASPNCPWWSGEPDNPVLIQARQFNGLQEGLLHNKLKHLIAELLMQDGRNQNTHVETAIIGEDGWKKPDVQTVFLDKKLALEVQLATTQVPTIISRERFYLNQGIHLIWLTWEFEKQPLVDVKQSLKDIYYCHNQNIFSLDEETISLSRRRGELLFRAYSDSHAGWRETVISLNDLAWPSNDLVYFYLPLTFGIHLRQKWIDRVRSDQLDWSTQVAILNEARQYLELPIPGTMESYDLLGRLISCIIALKYGQPFGTRETNLVAYLNTFFSAPNRHKYARTVESLITKFENRHLLNIASIQRKISAAKLSKQMSKSDPDAKILRLLFGDWV